MPATAADYHLGEGGFVFVLNFDLVEAKAQIEAVRQNGMDAEFGETGRSRVRKFTAGSHTGKA